MTTGQQQRPGGLDELLDFVADHLPDQDQAPAADPYPDLRAPTGPGAARQIALRHVAAGRHTHLSTDGTTECLSGLCVLVDLPCG